MNFLTITFNNNHYEYILYERTKIEFLDILASIGALFSTIKFFLIWFLVIIQKILIIIKY